ncbi:glycosyltransferase family protein [Lachnoanaerobaculum umeaense]|uniref:Beta-carotene 15,15'-monooxygenase n=1 Tax=Lachnoanaerobaculum umeaense TaxID=617123 RepID=A0A385Q0Y4_9FIRM|nr:glycosyltransferase family 39 protein [Lachnoanaerobaculum umeaense]AYA99234.1 beta-carotene 15,15'-monooxygenase [Lachnoanaerobaculum umeaense]PZW93171.1 dolichyl-phosphate-mannose-protein mannosyltransferase [Lachnoanaerobaculum umeaense]
MALIKIEEKYEYLKDVLFSILILCISIVVNAGISIKGLYQDDILMWSTRRGVGFIKYVFPDEMRKFRPVYWIVAWIYQGILNNNLILIVPINILIGAGIAIAVYFFAKRLAKSKEIAFVLAAMFAVSRFSYYNIGQFLGVMEAMALIFALAMLYFLYGYINGKNDMNFYYACIVYFINCFTHERFMVLFPMLLFAVIVKEGRRILNAAISIATFILIIYIRFMALKSFVPEGTGGSKVSETFKISDLIFSLKTEILYILGINTGPEYLCGIKFLDANIIVRVIIVISIIALIGFLAKFTYSLIMNSEKLNLIWIKNTLLFLGFIIGSIVCSAVTIRVEMRWIYAPYLFVLLLIAYIYGIDNKLTVKRFKNKKIGTSLSRIFHVSIPSVLFLATWAFCMIAADIYYRGYYGKIHIFFGQHRANSLANETYYKYNKDLSGKKIYIIKNYFKLSKFDALEFFRAYNQDIREDIVTFIDNYKDIGQVNDDMIILSEDLNNNEYVNVTDFLRSIKLENIYGHYSDGWTDEEARFNVMSGEKGQIHFEIMYPGELDGNEHIEIDVNGKKQMLNLISNITYYDIETTPNSVAQIYMKSDFYLKDAQEQRGETRMSFILNIKTE